MRTIQGFDYQAQRPVSLTAKQWRERLAAAIKGGGWRRHTDGETFIHIKGPRISAEIYGNVRAPA